MMNQRLESLNGANFDPELLDRMLEFGEALGDIKRHPGVITSKPLPEFHYMMQGFQEYQQEHEPDLDVSLL